MMESAAAKPYYAEEVIGILLQRHPEMEIGCRERRLWRESPESTAARWRQDQRKGDGIGGRKFRIW